MLQFFRNYQRFFFLIITGVIVVTFSFFGTNSSAPVRHNQGFDQTAFTLIDGTAVTRGEVEQMVRFIATDAHDKWQHGGARGLNGLNDGAIRKDFFESGLASVILSEHADLLAEDLSSRATREKRMKTYAHPQAKFLSAESAWAQYAPDLKRSLDELRVVDPSNTRQAFEARIATYLAEKKFPQQMLKQVLKYQQQQTRWIAPDPALDQQDLSIFGYRTLEDWFGRKFLHLSAQTIFQLSAVAAEKGYSVSDEEVRSDLMRIAAQSFRQGNGVGGGVSTFYKSQLRDLEMTERGVMKLWRHVLLARRLMQDVGSSVFVDPTVYSQFVSFAAQSFDVDIYEMPSRVRVHNLEDLLELEHYLEGIAGTSGELTMDLPEKTFSAAEVKSVYPELVSREYRVSYVEVDTDELQRAVSVQQMWEWQLDHWAQLKKEFPEVGQASNRSDDANFELLEKLDNRMRAKIDRWARTEMVKEHPEWVDQALAQGTKEEVSLSVLFRGGSLPFQGMDDREALMEALSNDSVVKYTQDDRHFYTIDVLERKDQPTVISFANSKEQGALQQRVQADLEGYYEKIRSGFASEFQTESGEWKPLSIVRERVLEERCSRLLRKIRQVSRATIEGRELTPREIAAFRFATHLNSYRESVARAQTSTSKDPLVQQWEPVMVPKSIRRDQELRLDIGELSSLSVGEWSDLLVSADGQPLFLQLKGRSDGAEPIGSVMEEGQRLLGEGVKRELMGQIAERIRKETLVSVDYLGGA